MRLSLLIASLLVSVCAFSQTNGTIQHDGLDRTYTYFIPPNMSPGPAPLVFVLHGTTQTGEDMIDVTEFNAIATANNFIVVYPDGIGNVWNVGFDITGASTADDLGFIEALLDLFVSQHGVNPLRVYSCGFSAGGYMSHRLACESSHCFAAIASVSGVMTPNAEAACAPAFNTSIMQIHGTSDLVVPYDGSTQSGSSVSEVITLWEGFDNCPSTYTMTSFPNTNLFDLSTVDKYVYAPCDAGSEMVHLKVNGGGHMWPGTSVILSGIGAINKDISASQEIWNFFSPHSCTVSGAVAEKASENDRSVYPNPATQKIQWSKAFAQPTRYAIYSMDGRQVASGLSTQEVDVHSLSAGVYILKAAEKSHLIQVAR